MDERLPIRCLAEELNGQLQGSVGMVGFVDGLRSPHHTHRPWPPTRRPLYAAASGVRAGWKPASLPWVYGKIWALATYKIIIE